MTDYLRGQITVDQYRENYFAMIIKRMTVPDEASKILQQAYGDADDYDSVVTLDYTISEAQLRERVAKSAQKLAALGYDLEPN